MLFEGNYKALVIGASGAIGSAFASAFEADLHCTGVERISRSHSPGFDLLDAASIAKTARESQIRGPYQVIVDATGALVIDGVGPEKSLGMLQPENLMQAYKLNAIGPAVVLQHFSPLLAHGPCFYAKLSARVGSIADNRKGGWYGYRASKAALNMLLQTAAIELQRKNPYVRVVALQPGTVRSALSSPFTKGSSNLLEPAQAVAGMLAALEHLQAKAGAHFIDHRGQGIPW
jgi:NAD(P)-dependent dehydrogenase (short-subunit alcohol dehydrogenase family)